MSDSNSVDFEATPTGELIQCPHCRGYHAGGCHRKPTPDTALRVAEKIASSISPAEVMEGTDAMVERIADLISSAFTERERELKEALQGKLVDIRGFLLNMRLDASDSEDPELAEYAIAIEQHLAEAECLLKETR